MHTLLVLSRLFCRMYFSSSQVHCILGNCLRFGYCIFAHPPPLGLSPICVSFALQTQVGHPPSHDEPGVQRLEAWVEIVMGTQTCLCACTISACRRVKVVRCPSGLGNASLRARRFVRCSRVCYSTFAYASCPFSSFLQDVLFFKPSTLHSW